MARYYDNEETGLKRTAEVTGNNEIDNCVRPTGDNWYLQVLCLINEEREEFLSDDELIQWYTDCMN